MSQILPLTLLVLFTLAQLAFPTYAEEPSLTLTPTPSLTPTFSPIPTVTLTPTLTVTTTPTFTLTPTPTPKIELTAPTQAKMAVPFEIQVDLLNFVSNDYYLKVLIGESLDKLYDGKTLGADGETWLAWNASWSKMPKVSIISTSTATLTVKTDNDLTEVSYLLVVRVREVGSSKSWDSTAIGLTLTTPPFTPTPTFTSTPTPTPRSSPTPTSVSSLSFSPSPQPFLSYSFLIDDVRQMDLGEQVVIEGVITSPPEILGSRVMYVEDESGGIKILLDRKDRDDLKLGDLVQITGVVKESFNERYLKVEKAEDVIIIGQGDLPDPPSLATGEIDEDEEGELVQIIGEVTQTSGNTFYLDDGSGEVKIYIKTSTGIDKPEMRVGYYSQVKGICSQYKDDYRILPRFQEDLLVSAKPIELGQVLGVSELPQTGFFISDLWLILLFSGLALKKHGSPD